MCRDFHWYSFWRYDAMLFEISVVSSNTFFRLSAREMGGDNLQVQLEKTFRIDRIIPKQVKSLHLGRIKASV